MKTLIVVLGFVLLTCPLALASPDEFALKFDEFQVANWEEVMARLDNFDITLKNEPGSNGVFIVYGGHRGRRGEAQAWGRCLKDYMVNRRGISADRIAVVNGGYLDTPTIEVWVSKKKGYIPRPSFTSIKNVKFRKGKIKSWRSLCNI
jgi:hypothetical protein